MGKVVEDEGNYRRLEVTVDIGRIGGRSISCRFYYYQIIIKYIHTHIVAQLVLTWYLSDYSEIAVGGRLQFGRNVVRQTTLWPMLLIFKLAPTTPFLKPPLHRQ